MEKEDTPTIGTEQADTQRITMLGYGVLAWSDVERSVETLTVTLLIRHGLLPEIAKPLAANLEFREQCKVSLTLAYQAGIENARMDRIIREVNSAQNELRNTRNRLMHDTYRVDQDGISKRFSGGAKFSRPQSRQLLLVMPNWEQVTHEHLESFIHKCFNFRDFILGECVEIIDSIPLPLTPKPAGRFHRLKKFWNRHFLRG